MPDTTPIRLENVSKCYRIYQNPQDRFKQAFANRWHSITGKPGNAASHYREHWALRDVSFELNAGEAVGILGRNGAGKSTLLQIIAGTLEPTSGIVQTSGRITALLELGSGFNPDFTGRENVFLNAQILGMTAKDAEDRFDDIAGFADIGDFIDQPVKTYSSGMMMRLAFAVQTAVDPKVLIVDEALSVGDMFFQAKCMSRINKLVDNGVTLLFVSHDVGAIKQLCRRAVLLQDGKMVSIGEARQVTDLYMKTLIYDRNKSAGQSVNASDTIQKDGSNHPATKNTYNAQEKVDSEYDWSFGKDEFEKRATLYRSGNGHARVLNVQMLGGDCHSTDFDYDEEATIRVIVRFYRDMSNVNLAVKIRTLYGTDVVFLDTRLLGEMDRNYEANKIYVFDWRLKLPLMHGKYVLAIGLAHPPVRTGNDWVFVDVLPHVYEFSVSARREGMIGGFVTLPASVEITQIKGDLSSFAEIYRAKDIC